MRFVSNPPFAIVLTLALLTLAARSGRAAEPVQPTAAGDVVATIATPQSETRWFHHLRIRKKAGLEYRRGFSFGERDLVFSVYGPKLRKKRVGLGFEVRF